MSEAGHAAPLSQTREILSLRKEGSKEGRSGIFIGAAFGLQILRFTIAIGDATTEGRGEVEGGGGGGGYVRHQIRLTDCANF